jgi:hypothetical protein
MKQLIIGPKDKLIEQCRVVIGLSVIINNNVMRLMEIFLFYGK